MVGKDCGGGKFRFVGCSMKMDQENWIEAKLIPGDYYVCINATWISFVTEYSYSIYGPGLTNIT